MAGQSHNPEYFQYSNQKDKLHTTQHTSRSKLRLPLASEASDKLPLEQFALLSPDLLFVLDQKLKNVLFVNPAAAKILKLNKDQKDDLKTTLLSHIVEKDLLKLRKLLQDNEQGETEVRLLDGQNNTRHFKLLFAAQMLPEQESPITWLCQAREIAKNKPEKLPTQNSINELQAVLNDEHVGTWQYDPQTQQLECDQRSCQLLGIDSQDSSLLSQVFQNIHPEDRAYAIFTAINTLKQQGSFSHEFRISLPDLSSSRQVAVTGAFIPDERSGVTKIKGNCLDLSPGKIRNEKSKNNEAFLDESQRIAKIGCFSWDIFQNKVTLTKELYRILDIPEYEDFSLNKFYAKVHPQDLPMVKKGIKKHIRYGGHFNLEYRIITTSGHTKVLWSQGHATQNNKQITIHAIGAIQDITEKKEKETAFNTQNLIVKSILGNLPVIILIIDKYGIVKSLLGSGLEEIGMKENQTIGQSIFKQYPAIGKYIRRVLEGETLSFTEELSIDNKLIHLLSYYFYDKERELAIGFSIDITAQKQTEQAFEQISAKNEELERMNKLMDMFVYAVAHDLKNPINNLDIISMLIKDSSSKQEQNEYMAALQKSVSRLKQTINGLMEVVEIESSRDLNSRMLFFPEILENVKDDLHALLQQNTREIKVNFQHPRIRYNEAFLTSILKNLLSNALKYSSNKQESLISIETKKVKGYIILSFSDNGIGIDLDQNGTKMFKPFKRFSKQAEGSGIGLYLIKCMIEKNGGRIEVKSSPGKGTTFTCYLIPYRN